MMKEWAAARDVLSKFDDRISDLRKYGFTVVTGLLTAQALFAKDATSVQRLGALTATLILICALRVADRNFEVFIGAASAAALILERRLNLILTEWITAFYREDRAWRLMNLVYAGFILGTTIFGLYLLPSDTSPLMLILGLTSLVFILLSRKIIHLNDTSLVDWGADRNFCKHGQPLRISLTNLSRKPIFLDSGKPAWKVLNGSGEIFGLESSDDMWNRRGVPNDRRPPNTIIKPDHSLDWFWDPGPPESRVSPGVYTIAVLIPEFPKKTRLGKLLRRTYRTPGRILTRILSSLSAIFTVPTIEVSNDTDYTQLLRKIIVTDPDLANERTGIHICLAKSSSSPRQ